MVLIRCPYLNQVTFLGSLMIYVCNQIKVNVILLMCLFCFTNYYFQYKNEKIPKKERKRKEKKIPKIALTKTWKNSDLPGNLSDLCRSFASLLGFRNLSLFLVLSTLFVWS